MHSEHFLSHPARQTLIHHNFLWDPVELETVDDFHLLGFNIDLPQRTITYIQPNQPWKIRDPTSAGSQRLALSGLASRLHAIYTYSFPPTTATAAAEELVRLYVQKGHDSTQCRRLLRKNGRRRLLPCTCAETGHVCVCVSNPVPKGLFHDPTFPCRGMERTCEAPSNEAPHMILGYRQDACRRTCNQLLPTLSTPLVCFMVLHVILPQNRFLTASQLLNAASTCTRCETLLNNTFLRTHAPFRSLTFLLSLGTELTENQCQSVYVSLSVCLSDAQEHPCSASS